MVLSDRTIKDEIDKGRIIIDPLIPNCIQPASVDLHLDKKLLAFKPQRHPAYIDVRHSPDHLHELVELDEDNAFFLNPGELVLASTLESITLPDDIVGRLEGKSSLGRIGLLINSTAGYVDPGWQGNLTIEISNVAKLPITLYYKMKIGQISFRRLTSPVDRLYGAAELDSRYQGQSEPTASRYHEDFVKG
ncbi:MAG: dCTP deaminase [Chloroflexota bacterium]|nr:MAG: dCTP deaminase [Chloroflexota bacterium]